MLDTVEKTELLSLARKTLETYFDSASVLDFGTGLPGLLERKGAFVSLHRGAELRGCIGQLEPDRELYRIVQYCTLSAAFSDSRFPPVQRKELEELNIEISVLTPMRAVRDPEEITVGNHGLYIVQGMSRGLLLPQVAQQYGWDRETFLQQTCHKAGLPGSAWKDPETAIYVFEADVFSEPEPSGCGAPAH